MTGLVPGRRLVLKKKKKVKRRWACSAYPSVYIDANKTVVLTVGPVVCWLL